MRSAAALAALALLIAAPAAAQDLLIRGGPIYTGVDGAAPAEAVLVRDGRIAWVGALADQPAVPADVPTVDLKGAALFPGFTDGHAHLDGIGWRELTLNLEGAASIAEAMQRLKTWAETHPDGPIVGRGWIETHWPEGRFLNRHDLDAAAPGRIVLLSRADGHAVAVSTPALQAAGITTQTQAPFGGEIHRETDGAPTGLLIDAAEQLVAHLTPQQDAAAKRNAYRAGFRVETAYGWTGLHFMSAPWGDIPMLEQMAEAGEAPLRLYNSITPDGARELIAQGPRSVADGRVVTRAIKFYADGALGSRGAALFAPYADALHTSGLMQTTAEEMAPLYREALRAGIQVATHAIGDRGNSEVLNWYLQAMGEVPPDQRRVRDPRWRIEHAQILRPRDEVMFTGLGVIPSMQPSHAIGDLHFAPARLGDARLDGAYAWHSLAALGLPVVGGSDAPVERGDPLIEFYAAVARRDLNGFQGPDWRPNEAVDRATALKMFTLWPAYASFREAELGTIEVGKRADLTAFSVDLMTAPFADIPKGHAVLTVVDGVVVYRKQ
ncbi:amidohydrolase [Brevundimonas sp.]|uniref:amidohydrolase n=1 Tax=Brevundimonas sp. TaxID=1871086 RepID=UPI002FD8D0F8